MPAPTKIQKDYNQIFSTSNVSSIPILDLSDNDFIHLKTSDINYKDVFSPDDDEHVIIGPSYQDLLSANLRYYC